MKKQMINALLAGSILIASCGQGTLTPEEEKHQLNEKINHLEQVLQSGDGEQIKPKDAADVLNAYVEYADKFKDDPQTAAYLFKAGEISIGIGNYQRAIAFFERLRRDYPNFEKGPESLFIIGFVYDSYLNQKDKAKTVYEEVIAKYPEHKFAQDAKASINLLTMSDEELIEMFQNKEAAADSVAQ